jgi:hypothetical protein
LFRGALLWCACKQKKSGLHVPHMPRKFPNPNGFSACVKVPDVPHGVHEVRRKQCAWPHGGTWGSFTHADMQLGLVILLGTRSTGGYYLLHPQRAPPPCACRHKESGRHVPHMPRKFPNPNAISACVRVGNVPHGVREVRRVLCAWLHGGVSGGSTHAEVELGLAIYLGVCGTYGHGATVRITPQ